MFEEVDSKTAEIFYIWILETQNTDITDKFIQDRTLDFNIDWNEDIISGGVFREIMDSSSSGVLCILK